MLYSISNTELGGTQFPTWDLLCASDMDLHSLLGLRSVHQASSKVLYYTFMVDYCTWTMQRQRNNVFLVQASNAPILVARKYF